MKFSRIEALLMAAVGMVCSHAAMAGTFSLGAGALMDASPYKGVDTRYYPVPLIDYEGDNFYFRSLMLGYYLWKDDSNKLSLTAGYQPFGFQPNKSDDSQMKRLDKRRDTAIAGLEYSHNEGWGTIRASVLGDVLNNSNGITADAAYLYAFTQDNWSLVPGVGVTWNSANQNKYYYGINSNESRQSGLNSYKPNSSFDPYVELSVLYDINQNWQVFFSGRYTRLSNEAKDSPMVDKSYTGVVSTGVAYTF